MEEIKEARRKSSDKKIWMKTMVGHFEILFIFTFVCWQVVLEGDGGTTKSL